MAEATQPIESDLPTESSGRVDDPGDAIQREQSTIVFPYADLSDAEGLARAIRDLGGGAGCTVDQLAARLNVSTSGGGFRARLSAGRIFGLLTAIERGRVSLTERGNQICDPARARRPRVDAFLSVPLYSRLYERYRNSTLPATQGLEAEINALGVSRKQTERARQIFLRSADHANFFWSGDRSRLVEPPDGNGGNEPATPQSASSDRSEKKPDHSGSGSSGGSGGGGLHPFIDGLLKTLPVPETDWPVEKRAKWLQAAAHVFDLIYADTTGSIEIKTRKEPQS